MSFGGFRFVPSEGVVLSTDPKSLERRIGYEAQLRAIAPRGPVYMLYGGDPKRALETLLRGDVGSGEHYAYLHRGPNDEVFYVGKGKNDRAYSKDRDALWHYYVKTRCNGLYEVEIVKRFDDEEKALDLESDLIALFGEHTVNAINTARPIDLKVNAQFHELRRANWAYIESGSLLRSEDPEAAEKIFRDAIDKMAAYARLNWERDGLVSELAAEFYPHWACHLNAKDIAALDKLTILLKSQGRAVDLASTIASFFALYPETKSQGISVRILKRADAAGSRPTTP
jgi:hypothetical protein